MFHTKAIAADDIRRAAPAVARPILRTVLITPTKPPFLSDIPAGHCMYCCNNLTNPRGSMVYGRYNPEHCHMNRWRTLEMHRHPALASFDYVIQLDTDLYVEKPKPYNPIARMAAAGAVVGFQESRALSDATQARLQFGSLRDHR